MGHATPDNGEDNINNILLINYVGNRSYSLASQSRGGDSYVYRFQFHRNDFIIWKRTLLLSCCRPCARCELRVIKSTISIYLPELLCFGQIIQLVQVYITGQTLEEVFHSYNLYQIRTLGMDMYH